MAKRILAICIVAGAIGCGQGVEHPAHRPLANTTPAETLATVNGIPISVLSAENLWRRNPSWTRDELMKELVDRELLAQEGEAQGTAAPSRVIRARKRGIVRAFLDEKVEIDEEISPDLISAASKRLRDELTTPAGFRVSHLVVLVRGKTGGNVDAASDQAGRKLAEDIAGQLGQDAQLDDLRRIQAQRDLSGNPALRLLVDPHLHFARPGVASALPQGWSNPAPGFAAAIVELAETGGRISKPIESPYGWHVAILEEEIEAASPRDAEIAKLAKERALSRKRGERLIRIMEEEFEKSSVALFPEVILAEEDPSSTIK